MFRFRQYTKMAQESRSTSEVGLRFKFLPKVLLHFSKKCIKTKFKLTCKGVAVTRLGVRARVQ